MATKNDKAKLAKGAKEIKKAEAQAKKEKPQPLVIPASTRPLQEILSERVRVLDGSIGLKIAEETPLEEVLRIMDWATAMSDHIGFMVGDVINFGQAKWGDKYAQAMEQTGRAYSTLAHYAMTARRIPAPQRQKALTFSAHREILRLGDEKKVETVLKEAGEQAEKGKAMTTAQLREKIVKLTPRTRKVTKAGKTDKRRKKIKLPPAYKPTDAEQERLDEAFLAIEEAAKLVGKLYTLVAKIDNKEKQRWVKATEPIVTFYNAVDRVTSYYN